MIGECFRCKQPGHWARDCPSPSGTPRPAVAPVADSRSAVVPVGGRLPDPERASGPSGQDWWKTSRTMFRPQDEWATPEATRQYAERARRAMEAKGIYGTRAEDRSRMHLRLALEDLRAVGRITEAEYLDRLAANGLSTDLDAPNLRDKAA